MSFKVGDKVTAYGLTGEVSEVYRNQVTNDLDIKVLFVWAGFSQWFLEDGRADPRHNEPTLKHLVPPKKTVQKTLYVAVQNKPDRGSVRGGHIVSLAYPSKVDAELQFSTSHQVVPLIIEVEE